jgi:hypothetical protein
MGQQSARAVLDYQPPTLQSARLGRRWLRGAIAVVSLAVWFVITMGDVTANTTWEHHPYGGPFMMLKESGSPADFGISLFIVAWVLVPIGAWIWTGKWWTALSAIAMSGLSVWMSYCFAAWASC